MSVSRFRHLFGLLNSRNPQLLPAVCVALLVVIAGLQLMQKPRLRLPTIVSGPTQLADDPDASAVSTYPALRAHPAFAPDRAPLPADVDVSGNLNGFEVLGVAMASNTAAALIRDSGGQIVRLKPGESVQSWRLVSVDRTQLVFDRNGERRTLTLDLNRARMAGTGPGAVKSKSGSDEDNDDSSSSSSSDDSDSDDSDN
jgi:hypothetical protein